MKRNNKFFDKAGSIVTKMHALALKVKARVKEMDSLATHAEKIGIDNGDMRELQFALNIWTDDLCFGHF